MDRAVAEVLHLLSRPVPELSRDLRDTFDRSRSQEKLREALETAVAERAV